MRYRQGPAKLRFESAAMTHPGKVRPVNEDSIIARPQLGVWAVADGVGGHEAGQLASRTVTDAIGAIGQTTGIGHQIVRFSQLVHAANNRILSHASEGEGKMMGSTVAGLLIQNWSYACLWSGDSRIYRLRDRHFDQLSHDHSEVQELIDSGVLTPETAKTWPRRNVITRAVGIFEDPGLELVQGEVQPRDQFLLCSDGLTGHVPDDEIADMMHGSRVQNACERLMEEALLRGGTDNISIVIVRCHEAEPTNFVPGSRPGEQQGTP